MSRITIDVAANEFDFIKSAIENKALTLINYMEHCKTVSRLREMQPEFPIPDPVKRGRPPLKKTARRTRK